MGTGTGASVWFPETGSSSCPSDLWLSDWESEREEGKLPESGWSLNVRSVGRPESSKAVHTPSNLSGSSKYEILTLNDDYIRILRYRFRQPSDRFGSANSSWTCWICWAHRMTPGVLQNTHFIQKFTSCTRWCKTDFFHMSTKLVHRHSPQGARGIIHLSYLLHRGCFSKHTAAQLSHKSHRLWKHTWALLINIGGTSVLVIHALQNEQTRDVIRLVISAPVSQFGEVNIIKNQH